MSGKAVLEDVRRYRTSLRCIDRLQLSVPIKNGRSWGKHLSMSVSPERSSKDTSLFATPLHDGKWRPPHRAVKAAPYFVLSKDIGECIYMRTIGN